MKIKAREGMRVHVHSADMQQDLGNGTIMKVGSLKIEELDLIIPTYPFQIVLDSGEVTEGCDCWWIPLGKEGEYTKERK